METSSSITGILATMLRISRFCGIAPLTFESTSNGWTIRLSKFHVWSGRLLALVLCTLSTFILIEDLIYNKTAYRLITTANRVVWIFDVSVVNIVVLTSVFTGSARMRCLASYIINLNKVKSQLKAYERPTQHVKLIVMVSISFSIILIFFDYGFLQFQVYTKNGDVLMSVLYLFYDLACLVLHATILQFFVIAMSVLSSIYMLNGRLKDVLQEVFHKNSFKKEPTNVPYNIPATSINMMIDSLAFKEDDTDKYNSIPSTVHQLGLLYCAICDIVRQINESFGVVLVALFCSFLVHLVITPYHITISLLTSDQYSYAENINVLLHIPWITYHLCNVILVIEPCHRTHIQFGVTKSLVGKMSLLIPFQYEDLKVELDLFKKHLYLNTSLYSPMKMFTLNRSAGIAILGSITTYLAVALNL